LGKERATSAPKGYLTTFRTSFTKLAFRTSFTTAL
jgi:hypothetical protein